MAHQSVDNGMRKLIAATLVGLAILLASPGGGEAKDHFGAGPAHRAQSAVTLRLSTGYSGFYRDSAWTPVRITLRNRTGSDIAGAVTVPEHGQTPSLGAEQSFHGSYDTAVTLPAGSTKQITLYIPGSSVQGQIEARFLAGTRVLAATTQYPLGLDSSALLVGVMGGSPGTVEWLTRATGQAAISHVVRLSAATVDPEPEALATFDIIVLDDVDTSGLDRSQLDALGRFVQNGGTLLLVGGPSWQQTLAPLPPSLLPGRVAGSRTVRDLNGLLSLGGVPRSRVRQSTEISVLTHSSGMVVASQGSVPLVVRKIVGSGSIEYLAFDPALDPVRSWRDASTLLGHLVTISAPVAVARSTTPPGIRARFTRTLSEINVTGELSNLPASRLPLLGLFALLSVLYVFLLGPASFLVLRRLHSQHLAMVTIPGLAAVFVGSVIALPVHLRGASVQLNTVGMVTLEGRGPYSATFYLGLVSPSSGDYHLTYGAPALPAALPQLSGFSFRAPVPLQGSPLGVRMGEGEQTNLTFPGMKAWSVRDVALDTAVSVGGTVKSDLRLDARGVVAGSIRNETDLNLVDPIVVAGQAIADLPTIPAHTVIHLNVRPNENVPTVDTPVWNRIFGQEASNDGDPFFWGGGAFEGGPGSPAPERTFANRTRNAASLLAQTQPLSALGNLALLGWSERPLGAITVDGSAPQRRELDLIAVPLTVHLPERGPFVLRPGTLGAKLVDIVPRPPQSSCCNWFSQSSHVIDLGRGGSVTFSVSVPDARHVRFDRLSLSVNASNDGGTPAGALFDWRSGHWISVDVSVGAVGLTQPNRFVGPDGRLLIRLRATDGSGDVMFDDLNGAVQLSGAGRVV